MTKFLPNFILWFILGMSLAIVTPFLAQAKNSKEEQVWKGEYMYPETKKRPPVAFELSFKQTGSSIKGKISEPNTFGDNGFNKLFASVKGLVGKNGTISFTKTYDGTAGVKHSVNYNGSFVSPVKIEGTWSIKDFTGTFHLTKEEKSTSKAAK